MNRKKIDVYDNLTEIVKELKEGVLLTAKADDQVNSMTISWGMLGIEWGRPVFVTFLREHRFTKELIDKNGEFTVNIPYGQDAKDILNFCGTKSGRDVDKFQELGLTPVEAEKISVPAIRELPLTLECKVVYKQEQDPDQISERKFFIRQMLTDRSMGQIATTIPPITDRSSALISWRIRRN